MKRNNSEEIRLNRFISMCGICSRRKADNLIEDGLITVNKKIIKTLGYKVQLKDIVRFQGNIIYPETRQYLLLNKPKGYITTMSDEKHRPTVLELIQSACEERLVPVGRLDKETTGLLLFTNDGVLSKKLMHPKHRVKKKYQVELNKELSKDHFGQIIKGLKLKDGLAQVDHLKYLDNKKHSLQIEIHIGKNRIIRRIFNFLGYEVQKLDRVAYAFLNKEKLPRGKWRMLTDKELKVLKRI